LDYSFGKPFEMRRFIFSSLLLAKKVQIELKACIGAPSQASSLELIQKSQISAENSIQALDKRIDAIQTVLHVFATKAALSLVNLADKS
jgi:hypothetical protein